jgi:inorganic pyrophosphatase
MAALTQLDSYDNETGDLNVIIETPKGSRNKFKYDEKHDLFMLSEVLPAGILFPFDFGFIPSTRGEDGDPLDVLVLMDEPAYGGCLVPCRLIGVIEAEQKEGGKKIRNDRLIAVTTHSHRHRTVQSLFQLSQELLDEIEHFFKSYTEMAGKEFKPIGRHGASQAVKLVEEGMRQFAEEHSASAS